MKSSGTSCHGWTKNTSSGFNRRPSRSHIQLASRLTPDHPCELSVLDKRAGQSEISIVAYDYFSEFATICGLLSAFGLNIEEGRIYTFAEAARPPARAAQPGHAQPPERPPRPEPQKDRRCLSRAPGEWRAIRPRRSRPPLTES